MWHFFYKKKLKKRKKKKWHCTYFYLWEFTRFVVVVDGAPIKRRLEEKIYFYRQRLFSYFCFIAIKYTLNSKD